jgi:hypothetical protein
MKTPLSKSLIAGLATLAVGVTAASAQTLYVRYDFNDPQTGSSIADSGGPGGFTGTYEVGNVVSPINSGPAGSVTGVSGLSGDLALPGIQNGAPTNSAVDMLQNGTSTFPALSGSAGVLKSFTFTFWFKGDITSSGGNAGRIYETLRGTPNNQTSILFYNSDSGNDFFSGVFGASGSLNSKSDAYSETNEWIFVALAVDANSDTFSYYKGSTTSGVSHVNSGSTNAGYAGWGPGQTTGGITASMVGNRPALERRLGAALDDFRIYGATNNSSAGALSLSQLDDIRLEGIGNIPEPSSIALIALALGGAAFLRRRRASRA